MLQFPFEFTGWDPADTFVFIFYVATFTENFGAFEKGRTYQSVEVDLPAGVLRAYDVDGVTVLVEQNFRMSPTD